jgi:hypothetical protein
VEAVEGRESRLREVARDDEVVVRVVDEDRNAVGALAQGQRGDQRIDQGYRRADRGCARRS